MRELAINRCLSEDTRKTTTTYMGVTYALHLTRDEAIFTDLTDYTKIYGIFSTDCLAQNTIPL